MWHGRRAAPRAAGGLPATMGTRAGPQRRVMPAGGSLPRRRRRGRGFAEGYISVVMVVDDVVEPSDSGDRERGQSRRIYSAIHHSHSLFLVFVVIIFLFPSPSLHPPDRQTRTLDRTDAATKMICLIHMSGAGMRVARTCHATLRRHPDSGEGVAFLRDATLFALTDRRFSLLTKVSLVIRQPDGCQEGAFRDGASLSRPRFAGLSPPDVQHFDTSPRTADAKGGRRRVEQQPKNEKPRPPISSDASLKLTTV